MKNIRYIFLMVMVLVLGCDSGFLDKTNMNSINVQSFYKTEDDAVKAINGAYSVLQHRGLYKRQYFTLDYVSGDFTITEGGFQYSNLPGFRFLPSEDTLVFSTWNTCFLGVARSNIVLERIPEIEMDESLKQRILAEARFLRGLYYFHLVTFYGGIPLSSEVINTPTDENFNLICIIGIVRQFQQTVAQLHPGNGYTSFHHMKCWMRLQLIAVVPAFE